MFVVSSHGEILEPYAKAKLSRTGGVFKWAEPAKCFCLLLLFFVGVKARASDDDSAQYVQTKIVPVRPPFPPTDHLYCVVNETSNKQIIATLHLAPLPPWTPPYRSTDQGGPFWLVPSKPFYVAEWPGGVTPECWLVSSHYQKMPPIKAAVRRRPKS